MPMAASSSAMRGEERQQQRVEVLARQRFRDDLVHGAQVSDRDRGVHGAHFALHRGAECERIARRADHPRQRNHTVGQLRDAIGNLGLRNVHNALAVVGEPGLGHVADDADDLPRRFLELRTEALADHHDLAQGVLLRPVLLRHGLVDHHHQRRAARIALREDAAAQQRDLQRVEVVRARPSATARRRRSRLWRGDGLRC